MREVLRLVPPPPRVDDAAVFHDSNFLDLFYRCLSGNVPDLSIKRSVIDENHLVIRDSYSVFIHVPWMRWPQETDG